MQSSSSTEDDTHTTEISVTRPPTKFPAPLVPLFSRPAQSIPLIPHQPFSQPLQVEIDSLGKQLGCSHALIAAIHLLNDDIARAHDIVTDRQEDQACILVHAILHRREGDYSNATYWWNRSTHPFLLTFYSSSPFSSSSSSSSINSSRVQASRFVDEVESLIMGKGGRSISTACGAQNALIDVKGRQERELKGLVRWLWDDEKGENKE